MQILRSPIRVFLSVAWRSPGLSSSSRTSLSSWRPGTSRFGRSRPLSASSSSSSAMMRDDDDIPSLSDCPLEFEEGPYSAAEVHVADRRSDGDRDDDDAAETASFLDDLRTALDVWSRNDYNSAWVHVPLRRASVIETLSRWGFDPHHADVAARTVVLKKWLRPDGEDKIPPFATHQVGCAGLVLNDRNELLLIREWSGPPSRRTPTRQWKMPGGLLDAGESFEEATCREVREETGVVCDFESILTFWHRHGLKFGKSDLYYVCLLRPRTTEITVDPVEVSVATWMSVDEFLQTQDHPLIHHVLRTNFGIQNTSSVGDDRRIEPLAEIQAGAVQWPNRHPYPTYSSVPRRSNNE